MDNNDRTLASYDEHVEDYTNSLQPQIHVQFRSWIDRALGLIQPGAEILEVGSGPGREADYIESRGFRVTRTDASKGFTEYLSKKGKSVKLLNVLTDELGENLAMVLAQAVLHHFDEQQFRNVLASIHVALKPGGLVVFSVKQGDGDGWTKERIDAPRYYNFWQKNDLQKVVEKAGFKVLEISEADLGKTRWLLVTARK